MRVSMQPRIRLLEDRIELTKAKLESKDIDLFGFEAFELLNQLEDDEYELAELRDSEKGFRNESR